MNDFVDECRREWARLRVPDPIANEMAADLAADLAEADADGASPEDVLGSGAFDPRAFAAAWARARGVTGATRSFPRRAHPGRPADLRPAADPYAGDPGYTGDPDHPGYAGDRVYAGDPAHAAYARRAAHPGYPAFGRWLPRPTRVIVAIVAAAAVLTLVVGLAIVTSRSRESTAVSAAQVFPQPPPAAGVGRPFAVEIGPGGDGRVRVVGGFVLLVGAAGLVGLLVYWSRSTNPARRRYPPIDDHLGGPGLY